MAKRILACLVVVMSMISCAKDDPFNENGDDVKASEEGVLSFFMTSSADTKQSATDDGSEDEQLAEDVWMLLYDYESGSVGNLMYAWNLSVEKKEGFAYEGDDIVENTADMTSFQVKAKKVKRQPYMMVFIVNPRYYKGKALTGFTNGTYNSGGAWTALDADDVSNLNPADPWYTHAGLMTVNGLASIDEIKAGEHLAYEEVEEEDPWDPNPGGGGLGTVQGMSLSYFFMSNANGLIPVTVDDIYETPEEAEGNPVPIHVDRALAKIGVTSELGTYTTDGGMIMSSLRWYLVNINKKTYMYRQFAPVFDWYSPETYYQGDMEVMGQRHDRSIMYAIDPNFWAGDNKLSDFSIGSGDDMSTTSAGRGFFRYVPENTLSIGAQEQSQYKEYATKVVVKTSINYDFDGKGLFISVHYYSYRYKDDVTGKMVAKVFTLAQAKEWMADPSGIPSDFGPDFKQYVVKDGTNDDKLSSFFVDQENSRELYSWECSYNGARHVIPCSNGSPICFHYYGINEYEIPIKHFNYSGDEFGIDKSYGYLGVVRNNFYQIMINSISGPGVPDVGGAFISADVTANPWYIRTQNEDLE